MVSGHNQHTTRAVARLCPDIRAIHIPIGARCAAELASRRKKGKSVIQVRIAREWACRGRVCKPDKSDAVVLICNSRGSIDRKSRTWLVVYAH